MKKIKILSLFVTIFAMTLFLSACEATPPTTSPATATTISANTSITVEQASSTLIDELTSFLSIEEKQTAEDMISEFTTLYNERIEKNIAEQTDTEKEKLKNINSYLDEMTIKYLAPDYSKDQNMGDDGHVGQEGITNEYNSKIFDNLKNVLSQTDYSEFSSLVQKHLSSVEKDYSEDMTKILSKYSELDPYLIIQNISTTSDMLASYNVNNKKIINTPIKCVTPDSITEQDEQKYQNIFKTIFDILPEGAMDNFNRFEVSSDGPDNLLAYVISSDDEGKKWTISVDPTDVGDKENFVDTIIHEYFHFYTLNHNEVSYNSEPTRSTYFDQEIVSKDTSIINAFYNNYWRILNEENISVESIDTYLFHLRHSKSFVSEYATTNVGEDIAEAFVSFVTKDKFTDNSIKSQKSNFFYNYPELVKIRDEIRINIDEYK